MRHIVRRLQVEAVVIPGWVPMVLSLAVLQATIVRGIDFVVIRPTSQALSYVEVLGVERWGVLFLVAAIVTLAGHVDRFVRASPVLLFCGHLLTSMVYAGYALALVQGTWNADAGWRSVSIAVAATSSNLIIASIFLFAWRQHQKGDDGP